MCLSWKAISSKILLLCCKLTCHLLKLQVEKVLFWKYVHILTWIVPKVTISHTCLHLVSYFKLRHCYCFSIFKSDFCCWWETLVFGWRWWGWFSSSSSCCTCCWFSITEATEKLIYSITMGKTVGLTINRPTWKGIWCIVTWGSATPWAFKEIFGTFALIFIIRTMRDSSRLQYVHVKYHNEILLFFDNVISEFCEGLLFFDITTQHNFKYQKQFENDICLIKWIIQTEPVFFELVLLIPETLPVRGMFLINQKKKKSSSNYNK